MAKLDFYFDYRSPYAYLGRGLMRWVGLYKVPFQRHPQSGQIDARRLLGATLAAEVWRLAHQPRSAWSFRAEIRPHREVW